MIPVYIAIGSNLADPLDQVNGRLPRWELSRKAARCATPLLPHRADGTCRTA